MLHQRYGLTIKKHPVFSLKMHT